MAYYLAVETSEKECVALNIKKSGYFGIKNHNEIKYECTLEEIISYTTKFENRERLMQCLLSEGIVREDDFEKPIWIVYASGIEVRKIRSDILYKDSRSFFENPHLVIEYIINKGEERDSLFFRKLSLTLPETSITTYMISKLATAMEHESIYNERSLKDKLKYPLKIRVDEKLIPNIAESLVQDCYIDGEGELLFSSTVDYEKLNAIISFINQYESTLTKEKENGPKKTRKPHRI